MYINSTNIVVHYERSAWMFLFDMGITCELVKDFNRKFLNYLVSINIQ